MEECFRFFESSCKLDIDINAACKANETANDAGEGKGGLFTDYAIAKGNYCQ